MASKYADQLKENLYGTGLKIATLTAQAIHARAVAVGKTEGWDKAREMFAGTDELKISDLRIIAGEHEFAMVEVLQAVEDYYVQIFDQHVAEAVKEVVFDAKLTEVQNAVYDMANRLSDLAGELNGEVGRKIEAALGPNSFWSESSGTC